MSRDRTVGDTFYIAFTTRAFATGVPTVLSGTPVISAYEDGGLTQITAGLTLGVDHDGVVGLNMVTVVATGGNGFESGKDYNLVITTGTVGGVSVVGEVIGQFSLNLSAAAKDLANGTDGLTALKTGLNDVPTVAEFNARTLVAASYFDAATDAVANVTLVATTTALTNKTGFALSSTGLDAISSTSTGMVEVSKAVWDRVISKANHNISQSAGKSVRNLTSVVIRNDTAQGSGTGSNQIQLDAGASATDGAYDPSLVVIVGGTGVGQTRLILQYDGATKMATVDRNWKVNPDATSEFNILADAGRNHVNEGLAQGGTANTITLNTLAASNNDVYIGQIVFIRSGTGEDQSGTIISYNGTTKVATVDRNWTTTPDTTSGYTMIPASPVLLASTNHVGAIIPTVTNVSTVATLTGHTVQTGDSFTRIGVAGAGLTNLATASNLATVDAIVDAILVDTADMQPKVSKIPLSDGSITWNSTALVSINGEVLDVMTVDTFSELTGVPAATSSIVDKLNWLYVLSRNKGTQTSTTKTLRNDADSADIATSTVSSDGTTFTRGEYS